MKEIVTFAQTVWEEEIKTNATSTLPDADVMKDIYIVNYDDGAGFTIVSADNRLPDPDGYYRLNMRHEWGLKMYFTDGPLIKIQWDQGSPFNDDTPSFFNAIRAFAGCV